jgi:hypothetical protein
LKIDVLYVILTYYILVVIELAPHNFR